ncbi:MAG: hypothetical protein KAS17_08450 [Victivallaceae bacterium]|nr:hypothetical protein [Victivallaceae bacterium]
MRTLWYIILIGLLSTAVTTLLPSCIKTVVKENPKGLRGNFRDNSLTKKSYKELKNYYLVLYPVGNNETITLDKDATVKLRLRNFAGKKIRIDEWYMKTPDNVILYYRPFNLRVKKFIAENWTKVSPKIEDKALRFELVLMPKNSVLVTRKLDFLKDLKLKKGETKKFLMLAELNLHSVKVRSSMFSIEVKQK